MWCRPVDMVGGMGGKPLTTTFPPGRQPFGSEPAWRSVELGVYAVYSSRKFVSPQVRLMIEFLVNAFAMHAWPA